MRKTIGMGLVMFAASFAQADNYTAKYEVTITNLTRGQVFTPQLVATHEQEVAIFKLGQPAGLALETLAEGGDTTAVTNLLLENPTQIGDILTIPGLLMPGTSVTTTIEASVHHRYFSMVAMLIPTNDTFVALNGIPLHRNGARNHLALGYDAGTEANDQNCTNIPGPRCGGAGHSPGPNEGDEGYVYVSNGFHELEQGDSGEVLGPAVYDWRNPVARVVVRRLR